MAGLVLLALLLRLFRADAQSLWYDEGTSVALVGRSLVEIARGASNDIHPPLYYWLLAAWARLAGDGVVALRAFSALLGAAVVWAVAALGRQLWGRTEGLLAGLLAATSPLLVWYSQEVRMYMLAAAIGAGLLWVTLDLAAARPGAASRRWLAWIALASAALHTHYLAGASVIAVAGAVLAMALARAWRATGRPPIRPLLTALAAGAVAALSFLPWLAVAWHTIRDWPAVSAPVTAAFLARSATAAFALGPEPGRAQAWLPALALAAGLGLAARGRHGDRWGAAVAFAYAAVPVAGMWLLSQSRPAWNPKFLVAAAPGFELLAGAGIVTAWRLAGRLIERLGHTAPGNRTQFAGRADAGRHGAALVVSGLLLLAVLLPRLAALRAMYFDPASQRDDYRAIVQQIARAAGPEDAVVLNAPTQVELFTYYDRSAHATYPLPLERPPDPAQTRMRLDEIGRRHDDLYAVLWATGESDPDGHVERWLNAHRFKAFDRWFGNVRLALWAAPAGPLAPATGEWAPSGGGEAVVGFDSGGAGQMDLLALEHGPPDVAAGDVLALLAVWRAAGSRSPAADYTVFVQLLDEADHVVAQRDMRPVGGTVATSSLARGGVYTEDRIGLLVPAETPAGTYRLILGLYDPATGERLTAVLVPEDGNSHILGDAYEVATVRVTGR